MYRVYDYEFHLMTAGQEKKPEARDHALLSELLHGDCFLRKHDKHRQLGETTMQGNLERIQALHEVT